MEATWKIFADCKSEDAALKLSARHFALVGQQPSSVVAEPYQKGGYVVRAVSPISTEEWAQVILLALSQAQAAGRAWVISGNVSDELDAWSNESAVPGITSVHLQVLCRPNNSLQADGPDGPRA